MIYENEYAKVDFFDWEPIQKCKKVGLAISGGTDSALVLYMLCNELKHKNYDYEIVLFTLVQDSQPMVQHIVMDVVDIIRDMFPEVNVPTPLFTHWGGDVHNEHMGNKKVNSSREFKKKLIAEGKIDSILSGRNLITFATAEEQATYGLDTLRVEPRPSIMRDGIPHYEPLSITDKKFVAKVYEDEGLLETLFPHTISCTGNAQDTDYFTKVCEKCWSCQERKWAFGVH